MVPVYDKRYHIYNRFRHFWAEIKKLWNYPLTQKIKKESILPVCDKTYYKIKENLPHWDELENVWNYALYGTG